jgi:hypothetical protein
MSATVRATRSQARSAPGALLETRPDVDRHADGNHVPRPRAALVADAAVREPLRRWHPTEGSVSLASNSGGVVRAQPRDIG